MGKRDRFALLSFSSWCLVFVALLGFSSWWLVIVVWLFLVVAQICLLSVIVVFPDHTHLLFLHCAVLTWLKLFYLPNLCPILNETSKPPVNKTHFFNITHLLLNCLK